MSSNERKFIFMKKGIIISLALLLVVVGIVAGSSYAYFTATVTGNTTATATTLTTGTMKITFTDGTAVAKTNWIPGDTLTKTFTVKNTGTNTAKYNITLASVTNTFGTPADLVYTITGTGTGATSVTETQMLTAAGSLATNVSVGAGVTQSYTLTITFKNRAADQNTNQGKNFSGTINIVGIQ